MVKAIFNGSTNIIGGGIRNSALFIISSRNSDKISWNYIVSKEIDDLLTSMNFTINSNYYILNESPSRSKHSRKLFRKLIDDIKPDFIYTMAGPAYIRFKMLHFQGLSNAFITHPTLEAIFLRNGNFRKIKYFVHILYQLFHSRQADYFLFQTHYARNSYCKKLLIPKQKTFIAPNAFDANFLYNSLYPNNDKNNVLIFCPGAGYPHKGFQFIPMISYNLRNICSIEFKFILTLENGEIIDTIKNKSSKLGVSKNIENIGVINYSSMLNYYKITDIVFVPSLLETFSATYLEAFAARKPLVVSDRNFARDICGDAAMYVNPKDSMQTAYKLKELINCKNSRNILVGNGTKRLSSFPSQEIRYEVIEKYLLEKTYLVK